MKVEKTKYSKFYEFIYIYIYKKIANGVSSICYLITSIVTSGLH